jgi:hypothetical protein
VFEELPTDLCERVFEHLDAGALVRAGRVSRAWHSASESDALWRRMCARLWVTKVYVPERFTCPGANPAHRTARERYTASLADAKRVRITRDEVCELTWFFRFKSSAGRWWTLNDTYWQGFGARSLRFLPDGRISRNGSSGDGLTWTFAIPPMDEEEDGKAGALARESILDPGASGGTAIVVRHPQMGRFPTELVSRHSDWGFLLSSAWVVYANTPMDRSTARTDGLSDSQLDRLVKPFQWAEAEAYNTHLVSDDESEGEESVDEGTGEEDEEKGTDDDDDDEAQGEGEEEAEKAGV